jgi:hypothetical protein
MKQDEMTSASQLLTVAERLFSKGLPGGAAELYVEAAESAIRAFANERGWPTDSQHDILVAGGRLPEETGDREFTTLFSAAVGLMFNDTRGWTAEEVEFYRHQVKRLVEKLVALTPSLTNSEE